jgi:hypothetical protein
MRHLVALIAMLGCSAAASASNGVLFSNLPVAPTQPGNFQDGSFSDAMSSVGEYTYSQAFGQGFRLAGESTVKGLRLWGASEYVELPSGQLPQNQQALSPNITKLEVRIYRVTAGTTNYPVVYAPPAIVISSVTQVRNGTFIPNILSPVFQLDMVLENVPVLSAGDYMITVGGVLEDPDGSAFAWVDGQGSSSAPGAGGYITTGDIVQDWGYWSPTNSTSAMELYGIPAPGTLAVLAMAAFGSRRKRRP